jgi:hypothetical protein
LRTQFARASCTRRRSARAALDKTNAVWRPHPIEAYEGGPSGQRAVETGDSCVKLGLANGRTKDFYDLAMLAQEFEPTGSSSTLSWFAASYARKSTGGGKEGGRPLHGETPRKAWIAGGPIAPSAARQTRA